MSIRHGEIHLHVLDRKPNLRFSRSMPTPGLALIGFMSRERAMQYLREACLPPDNSDAALEAEWQTAKARLGAPIQNAGIPDIRAIPAAFDPYIADLQVGWPMLFQNSTPEFRLVEAKPLLAFQFHVDGERSNHHCGHFATPPSLQELLETCLPATPTEEHFTVQQQPQSIVLKARSLNIHTQAAGMIQPGIFGIHIGLSLPFVHVVRYAGKCFLHNGFHRALGAVSAGATHLPCLFRDVATPEEIGLKNDGSTFDATLMQSPDAPTVAHFADARAHAVILKATTRILHVSWAEYGLYDE